MNAALTTACAGSTGLTQLATDIQTLLLGYQNYDQSRDMLEYFKQNADNAAVNSMMAASFQVFLHGLTSHIDRVGTTVDASIKSLETYATFYNKSDAWACVLAEDFAKYVAAVDKEMSRENVFAKVATVGNI
jgi:hypothetical protein